LEQIIRGADKCRICFPENILNHEIYLRLQYIYIRQDVQVEKLIGNLS
jgi:hypothetical protein